MFIATIKCDCEKEVQRIKYILNCVIFFLHVFNYFIKLNSSNLFIIDLEQFSFKLRTVYTTINKKSYQICEYLVSIQSMTIFYSGNLNNVSTK